MSKQLRWCAGSPLMSVGWVQLLLPAYHDLAAALGAWVVRDVSRSSPQQQQQQGQQQWQWWWHSPCSLCARLRHREPCRLL